MSGILSGKHAGFLSEEIFTEDVNTEAVDGDLLAEELEKAQEDLFIEQEKFNTAIEAECETNETVDEIEAALESGSTDVVYAKLLVNKLIKNNSIFYGDSKPLTSGLESDRNSDAKTILTAGLEDAKGMLNSIKEFIAKVWQKIKDAFAWVWKKMKDFWAWLTGASKKVEEKKEETVVAASAVNAAADKSDDIKKAAEDVMENKNPDDILKSFRKRQNITEALNANKIDGNSGLTVQDGEFKGKDIGSLSKQDFEKWMSEGKNKDIAVDVVIENIIVEEVAKQTGLTEEKVAKVMMKTPAIMRNMKVFAFDPKLKSIIVDIVNKNIKDKINNNNTMQNYILKTALYGNVSQVRAFSNTLFLEVGAIQESFHEDEISDAVYDDGIKYWVGGAFETFSNIWMDSILRRDINLKDTSLLIEKSTDELIYIVEKITKALIDYSNLKEEMNKENIGSMKFSIKGFVPAIPLSINLGEDGSEPRISILNSIEKTDIYGGKLSMLKLPEIINKARGVISSFKISEDDLLKRFGKPASIGKDVSTYTYKGHIATVDSIEKTLDKLNKTIDSSLKQVEAVDSEVKKNPDWRSLSTQLMKFVSHSSYYKPGLLAEPLKSQIDTRYMLYSLLDIPGAIAQASKEFDSSKFKFDKK